MTKTALAALVIALSAASARADEELLAVDLDEPGPVAALAQRWRAAWAPPTAGEAALMAAADALVVVDVLQTMDLKRHPASDGISEHNLLLGSHPSDLRLVLMAGAGAAAATGAWYALPPRVRWLVPVALAVAEGFVIYGNHEAGLRIRF